MGNDKEHERPAGAGTDKPWETSADLPKHRQIYHELLREITSGVYRPGDRLPSESALGERFSTSRITVAKAIQQLQREKLVSRIAGSGTYIDAPPSQSSLHFGLLIPELGSTEIFEPICQGMMTSPLAKAHSLIWGHFPATDEDRAEAAEQLCHQYIAQKVAGVFFAPIEFEQACEINRRIVSALQRSQIPVVLLDRCFEKYPDRAPYDLVGIHNHRAGFAMTRHLLRAGGARRVAFAARPHSASTVDARIAGYLEALRADGKSAQTDLVFRGDFGNPDYVAGILRDARPDAFLCANDATAAALMLTLGKLGVAIPQELRLAGIDDVRYAKLLPVPLTTLHQNCQAIGAVAFSTMLDRLQAPGTPPREIFLPCEMVVRESCGARLMQARRANE